MRSFIKNLTFEKQIVLGLIVGLILFICSTIFSNGIFCNIAWIVYGLLFILNPVYPTQLGYSNGEQKAKRIIRIAGGLAVIIGLITRFGV